MGDRLLIEITVKTDRLKGKVLLRSCFAPEKKTHIESAMHIEELKFP